MNCYRPSSPSVRRLQYSNPLNTTGGNKRNDEEDAASLRLTAYELRTFITPIFPDVISSCIHHSRIGVGTFWRRSFFVSVRLETNNNEATTMLQRTQTKVERTTTKRERRKT